VFHPAAVEVMDEHPDSQLGRTDFLEHGSVQGYVNLGAFRSFKYNDLMTIKFPIINIWRIIVAI
jgi:hypothetical protein